MYIGYKEVQEGHQVSFFLEGAFGGEVKAAIGELDPSGVLAYSSVHPALAPIQTTSKDELKNWLQSIISTSNKTMTQQPAEIQPADRAADDDDINIMQVSEDEGNPSDVSGSEEEPGEASETESEEEEKLQAAPSSAPKSDFRFVSYRDEVRGYSETGDPPRKLRHWLIKDVHGREHVAVDTTRWEQGKKRFTYEAVAPFNQVKPMTCYNQRGVMEYLNQFLPPEARQAIPEQSGQGSQPGPTSPKNPSAKKKSKAKAGAGHKSNGLSSARKDSRRLNGGSEAALHDPGARGTFISDPERRNVIRGLRMATVQEELAMLRAECGVEYSLTLVGSDGKLEVLTSGSTHQGAEPANEALDFLTALAEEEQREGAEGGGSGIPPHKKSGTGGGNSSKKKRNSEGGEDTREKRPRVALPEDPDVAALCLSMENNTKMYLSGRWHRDPFPSHPLNETLETFQVAEDCGEVLEADSLAVKLMVHLPTVTAAGPGATSEPPGESDILVVVDSLPEPVSGEDVELQAVWGLDSYTRTLILTALEQCPELDDEDSRDAFIDCNLLPAVNALGDDGWDLIKALERIESRTGASPKVKTAAARVVRALIGLETHCNDGKTVRPEARKHVRAHPKGEGVVVTRRGGLPAGTFLGEYLGELYSAWRWAERDQRRVAIGGAGGTGTAPSSAAAARRAATRMGASPEYYNIVLERPKTDPRGYDVLYVDAVERGNFVSRLSHSCGPNCRSVTVAVNGRLTVGVWTTRDVAVGEELTLDFAGETDVEREAHAAVCLCGSAACRGSFLYLSPGQNSPLNAVASAKLALPDRCRMILDAAANPTLTGAEKMLFDKHGFRELLLHDGVAVAGSASVMGEGIPQWLKKWTALALTYVEAEAAELKITLPGSQTPGGDIYTAEEATEEVDHQIMNRVHSLATTLDKAKMFLRHQTEELKGVAPLCPLSDDEVVAYLWTGENSIAKRVLAVLSAYAHQKAAKGTGIGRSALRRGSRRPAVLLPRWASGMKSEDEEREGTPGLDQYHKSSNGGTAGTGTGTGTAEEDDADDDEGNGTSLSDLVQEIEALLESAKVTNGDSARAGLRQLATLLLDAGPSHIAMHDVIQLYAATRTFMRHTEYLSFASQLANGTEGLRYRSTFLWALLCGWHRASDVMDQLFADRKGTVCLPDVECCYMPFFAGGKYAAPGGERSALLRHISTSPKSPWPKTNTNFTFKNPSGVFGSPQMDVALREDGAVAVAGLVESLQAAAK